MSRVRGRARARQRAGKVRGRGRARQRVCVGAPDPGLTPVAGMAAVSELVERLDVIGAVDRAVGPIKQRDRGHGAGGLLVGIAAAQLAGEDFLVGLDRQRDDAAGQLVAPVPGLCASTAAGLARRIGPAGWLAVETGLAEASSTAVDRVEPERREQLCGEVTIDLDTSDVEVFGRKKRGVARSYEGKLVGRPHVATWAEPAVVLAADLMAGDEDPRGHAVGLLRRALAALPAAARAGRVRLRADGGYFAGELARAALAERLEFAVGAKRIAPLWRLLDGIAETDWTDALDMPGAQVAVASYRPGWWPAATQTLVRRVRLSPEQISADPRARRRRTLHPDQRALPIAELRAAEVVYSYSFILTNIDVSTPDKAAAVEHWYRHRTEIENVFRDGKHGAALRHLPSGYPEINRAWMWGALLAATMAGWLHELTATRRPDGTRTGHGERGGRAMIATLRHRLIRVPARIVRHAGQLILRPPPGHHHKLATVLARLRALPTPT